MTWLRIDDGFTSNGKIAQLTDREFRAWMRLLCHCAKVDDPTVDEHVVSEIRGVFRRHIDRFLSLNLLDSVRKPAEKQTENGRKTDGKLSESGWEVGEMYEVHDWEKYLPKDTASERQARWRARKAVAEDTPDSSTSASTNASTETSTRARAHAVPVPSRPVLGALGLQVLAQEAAPLPEPSETLPIEKTLEDRNQHDPVLALLAQCRDADPGTERVLRSMRLPEYAYRTALEEIRLKGGGSRLAVTILQRIRDERSHPPGTEPEPYHPYNGPKDPALAIETMIRNGAITTQVDLEAELAGSRLNGAAADKLRTLLPAEAVASPGNPEVRARHTHPKTEEPA